MQCRGVHLDITYKYTVSDHMKSDPNETSSSESEWYLVALMFTV